MTLKVNFTNITGLLKTNQRRMKRPTKKWKKNTKKDLTQYKDLCFQMMVQQAMQII